MTDLPVDFRQATVLDAGKLLTLIQSAYRGDASRAGWTTEADLLEGQRTDAEELASILGDREAHLLVATLKNEIVGCVLSRREHAVATIGLFAVRPDLQALGLGKRLLAEVEKRAQRIFGVYRARMTVIAQRVELIAWYVRRGYVVTGRTEPFPYGNARFGLPTRGDLQFVVLEKVL
ncbi:MAG: GNAT family N-acetyltransferase [Polyangiaceae bacterium]